MRLPSHDRVTQTVPDAMHTVKCVIEGIFHLVTGRDDNENVQRAEANIGRFQLHFSDQTSLDPKRNSDAPYRLSASQLKVAQERVHHICVPSHADINPRYLFSRSSKLKSHDWKQVKLVDRS